MTNPISTSAAFDEFEQYKKRPSIDRSTLVPHALIVEDDLFSQRLFTNIIKDTFEKCEIICVSTYEKALSKIRTDIMIKFAIVDVFLEGQKSGIDLYNLLRKAQVPIPIIITSNLPNETLFEMIDISTYQPLYLKKPFQPKTCKFVLEAIKSEIDMEDI